METFDTTSTDAEHPVAAMTPEHALGVYASVKHSVISADESDIQAHTNNACIKKFPARVKTIIIRFGGL